MKKLLVCGCIGLVVLAICAAILVGGYLLIQRAQGSVQAKVLVEEGSVKVTRADNTSNVTDTMDLIEGDKVETDSNSTATIVFANNSVTRLANDTELVITKLSEDGNTINLQMLSGQIWNRVQKVIGGGEYVVEGNSVVAAVRGTAFDFNMKDTDHRARVAVIRGVVGVNDRKENRSEEITADDIAIVGGFGDFIVDRLANNPLNEEWQEWNEDKDTIIDTILKNHPKLMDRLDDIHPRRTGGILGNPLSGLPVSDAEWSLDSAAEFCSNYSVSDARDGIQAIRQYGSILMGPLFEDYIRVIEIYADGCEDGVMTEVEFRAFTRALGPLEGQ